MANELTRAALNEREAAFVRAVSTGLEPEAAALSAGYAPATARTVHLTVMRRPEVLAAIHVEVGRAIIADAAIARKVVSGILQDKDASEKVRSDIAFKLMDRAGHIAPRARSTDNSADKPLNELTVDELKNMRETLERELSERAKAVNAPSGPIIEAEAVDLTA